MVINTTDQQFMNHISSLYFIFPHVKRLLFRPTLMGEELYTRMGFFVQTILADRYNHRIELRVVSLKSPSSVEYGIKKF